MKKILHIIDSLELGGAEFLVANTIPYLTNYEHIVVHLSGSNEWKDELDSIPVINLDYTGKASIFKTVKRLKKIIEDHNIDYVHAHLYWSTIIARLATRKSKKVERFFFSLHTIMSLDSFNQSKIMLWLEKLTYKKKHCVIAVSETVLKDYDKVVGLKGPNHILHNFVTDAFFEKGKKHEYVPPSTSSTIRMVAVGNIKPVKNYQYLFEAFQSLKFEDFQLDIYGKGNDLQHWKQKVKDANLNITFKGSATNLNEILPNYHLYIIPSTYEGFGIAPLEAMAVGIPVLVSDIDVFKEVTKNVALFFDPHNPSSLLKLLDKIKAGQIDLVELSKNGKKQASEISAKNNYLTNLNAIYLS